MSTDTTLYDKKWRKFLRRAWLFRFVPFVDFVLAAGSLATGNMREDSDFDVIVGVRQGRIFTVRMFCFIGFGMFGLWARHPGKSKDRICFNHFVTPAAYRLSPPYNEYWKNLYRSLVPVFGSPETIQKFYDANAEWLNSRSESPDPAKQDLGMGARKIYQNDPRHKAKKSNWIKRTREWLLDGTMGDWLEEKLKKIQIRKINAGLKFRINDYTPRIIVSDDELEFHPDTRRIQNYIERNAK